MAVKTDDINKAAKADPVETETEATEATVELAPGHHVMVEGQSLGCYPTEDDAKAFAEGHLAPQKIDYTIEEVA